MSDQPSQPPKPKPGSLRDRIAAFEKSATAAPAAPAPTPRPKPAGFSSWKPKAPSPPSSPSAAPSAGATEHAAASSSAKAGGMSASDAKESITKAGSLKDRMAALQGKGAFGAPPPPTARKPAVEKPKWKPPPVVQTPVDDDDHAGEHSTAAVAAAVERTLSPPVSVKSQESVDSVPAVVEKEEAAAPAPVQEGDNEGEPAAADPEDEERQRRAAIAARMARLGGARVGMAPPVFGKKPPVRRPTQEEAPAPKTETKVAEELTVPDAASPGVSKPAEEHVSPPVDTGIVASPPSDAPIHDQAEAEISKSPEILPTRKNSEAASVLSSQSTDSHPSRNPTSMPVPSVPRRAGPPRKKPVKTPTLPPPDVPEEKVEEPTATPAEADNAEKSADAPVEVDHTEKAADAPAETEDTNKYLDEPAHETEKPTLVEEAVKIIEHEDPKILEDTESDNISKVEDDSPESKELEPTSLAYLESPVASSTLTEEVDGIRAPPPSSLGSGQDTISELEADAEAAAEISASPPVPVLHTAPHALHEDEATPKKESQKEPLNAADVVEEPDAAEEEARKKRVADRMAKMGGINPFAPPTSAVSPPAEEIRSPPLASATVVPSPSATPVAAAKTEDPSPSLEHTHTSPKGNGDGSKAEEESSDEDEGEDDVLDDQWTPSASHEQDEKPKAVPLPHSDSHPESLNVTSSPPPPIPSTRSPVQVQQYTEQEEEEEEESDYGDDESAEEVPVAAPARLSNLPGYPAASSSPSQHLSEASSPPSRPAQPPRRIIPQAPEQVEEEEEEEEDEETDEEADERLATSQLFVPPPSGRGPIAIQPRGRHLQEEEDGDGSENDAPALPVPHRVSMEGLPSKSIVRDDDSEADSDHDGQALPIPPRRTAVPRMAQPPVTSNQEALQHPPHIQRGLPPPPGRITPSLSISGSEEILDEEEGGKWSSRSYPIDPAFHSPSRQTSFVNLRSISQAQEEIAAQAPVPPARVQSPLTQLPIVPATSAPEVVHQQEEEPEQDAEQLRRKTIAERMAKLGGIRFGAAPMPTPPSRPQPRQEEEQKDAGASVSDDEPAAALSEEEEERARKERISAKLANMGGMRIGMMPMGAGGLPQRSHVLREENVDRSAPAPTPVQHARAVPPSRPPPPAAPMQAPQGHDTDSDYGSAVASEDGVKVEAEESEVEESGYEHVEEAPPPVPSRAARAPMQRQSTGPSSPPIRPPVPTAMPPRRSSTIQSTKSTGSASGGDVRLSPQQKRSSYMPQSEYVMVEEPENQEAPLPPPPARPSNRAPPARSTPQVPQPPMMPQTPDMGDSISSQWELPSIPNSSLDFDGGPADLSMSWTDAAEPTSPVAAAQPHSPPPPPPPSKGASSSTIERQLSADDLMALWGRVGVQVCEVATSLYEKSRKTLIGDGSYAGFVHDVLAAVPNAAPAPSASGEYGYTIYVQNGPAVVKRVSEIMPGDVVEIHDAKLKGHKGIQTYHQTVGGAGEMLIGVVGEFEAKKSKIRVFHANQHVGQQTVESVSYRLEDLKSGIVKVYRVLDA